MEDKLILGGHEFHSRFILGSGKYNLGLIKAAVEEGEPDARLKILPAGIEMDGVAGNFQRAVFIFPPPYPSDQ